MKRVFMVLMIAVCASSVLAQETAAPQPAAAADKDKDKGKPPSDAKDNIVTTSHTATIGGEAIKYTARAGTMIMKDEDGKPQASVFFVAYTKDGADPAKRPVTYTFNGGPGSSSVWLHMGAFGPKRVAYKDDEGHAPAPPYRLTDNEDSILDVTDLVFVDPVTTGYSRAIPTKEDQKYHGVDADVRSVAESERFALGEYTLALMQGESISDADRKSIVGKVARYTGLTPEYIDEANM